MQIQSNLSSRNIPVLSKGIASRLREATPNGGAQPTVAQQAKAEATRVLNNVGTRLNAKA